MALLATPIMTTGNLDVIVPKPKDDAFYFTLITFKIEDILFRVPRHPFESRSEVFKDMLSLPATNAVMEGTSDEKPLILHGVYAKDFRALLRVLFDTADVQQSELSQAEWTSVIRLSHTWIFDELFNLAIKKLGQLSIDPTTRVVLAKSYGIFSWLRPAYFKLAMRTEPPTMEDVNELGIETILKLVKVREKRYRWIIENENLPSSYYGFFGQSVEKRSESRSRLLDASPNTNSWGDELIDRHNAAIQAALTDVFGLESTIDVPSPPTIVSHVHEDWA